MLDLCGNSGFIDFTQACEDLEDVCLGNFCAAAQFLGWREIRISFPFAMLILRWILRVSRCLIWSFPSLQCSSWRPGSWSTPLVWTPLWSGPSAGNLTSTMPASVRSAGATCWPSSGSCSPCSCPSLPNTRRRSSYLPPPYLRSYSAPTGCAAPVVTTLPDLGEETPAGFQDEAFWEGPSSNTHCLPASFMWWFNFNRNVWCFNLTFAAAVSPSVFSSC